METYAGQQGFKIIGITVEQASGMDFSRRGLSEVSAAVAAGKVDLLLVRDLSRLGRDAVKTDNSLRWLRERQAEVVCADGTIPQTGREILTALLKESGISLNRVR